MPVKSSEETNPMLKKTRDKQDKEAAEPGVELDIYG